ncbi:MAG: ActD-like protein [Cystobacter sp.]
MISPPRTPDWLLERIALRELPPEEWAAARARLSQEPDGERRLAALEADHRDLLGRLPPATVAREVERRARRAGVEEAPPRTWLRFAPALALVPVLAAVLLRVAPPGELPGTVEGVGETRLKGLSPQLRLHRLTSGGPEVLSAGASVAAGDVVQVSYVASGARYGFIFSVDGGGHITPQAPTEGSVALPLEPSGIHPLPSAYALDDAPAFERFFFVTSDRPFSLEAVLPAARALVAAGSARTAPLALPEPFHQVSFTLGKSPR